MNFFVAPPSDVLEWFNSKGYYGSLYDCFMAYVSDGSSLAYGTEYDYLNDRLQLAGYSGDLDDMLNTMFMEKTGEIYRYDAERSFFNNYDLELFLPVGTYYLRDDNGNYIRDDGGYKITV